VAYNAAPQTDLSDGSPNDALDTLYPFEDATERMSEILAGSRALTATTLKGGVSPPAPVSLLPSGIEGAITRFFVTPIGHAVTFATGAVANTPVINGRAIVGPRRQTRSDLTTEILLAGDNPNSDTTVAFDRDENPISGQQPRTVTCVGAIDAETLLSEGARREFGEFGGWSAVAVRSPGPLAELSGDPNRPTAARTRNTNQAIVIKLEFRPDGQFLGQPLNSAFNSALWLRQGRRESVATPPSPIRTVPDNRQNRIDVGEDFVGDRLELAPR
ncbi:MAG: hypothetical protein LM522_00865, partial [Candidatus Contendobacter sp.]|nr:hypothetical protein [Candidatus Contendobacter sp.]